MASSTLVSNAFLSDVQALATEASRKKLTPVKDALNKCVTNKCSDTTELWNTLLMGADAFHRTSKQVLSCVSNLGKMATLQLVPVESLPFACCVLRRLASISIQEQNDRFFHQTSASAGGANSGSGNLGGGAGSGGGSSSGTSAATSAAGVMASVGAAIMSGGNFGSSSHSTTAAMEEEFQLRIVQTIIAFVSACEVGRRWIEEPLGAIFYLYINTRSPIVQAACSATISQTSHSVLQALAEADDSGENLESQAVAASYFTDLCRLSAGNLPTWLHLLPHEGGGIAAPSKIATGAFASNDLTVIPHCLQLLILDIMINFFSSFTTPLDKASPLFTQALNEDLVVLVMGCLSADAAAASSSTSSTGSPTASAGNSANNRMNSPPPPDSSSGNTATATSGGQSSTAVEIFTKTLKLGMCALNHALPLLRPTAKLIVGQHVVILQSAINKDQPDEGADNNTTGEGSSLSARPTSPTVSADSPHKPKTVEEWKIAILLTLWRKALSDYTFLQRLVEVATPFDIDDVADIPIIALLGTVAMILQDVITFNRRSNAAVLGDSSGVDGVVGLVDDASLSCTVNHIDPHEVSVGGASADFSVNSRNASPSVSQAQYSSSRQLAALREQSSATHRRNSLAAKQPQQHRLTSLISLLVDFTTMSSQTLSRLLEAHKSKKSESGVASAARDGSLTPPSPIHARQATLPPVPPSPGAIVAPSEGLVEADNDDATANRNSKPPRMTANSPVVHKQIMTALIPKLLRCCSLAIDYVDGEDIIHAVLKSITHLVHCACLVDFPAQRDALLHLLQHRLMTPVTPAASMSPSGRMSPHGLADPVSPTGGASPHRTTSAASLVGISSTDHRPTSPGPAAPTVKDVATQDVHRRLHIMSQLVSIASGMGNCLHEGWSIVMHCFLAFVHEVLPDAEAKELRVLHEKKALQEAIKDVFASGSFFTNAALETVTENLLTAGTRVVHKCHTQTELFASPSQQNASGRRSPSVGDQSGTYGGSSSPSSYVASVAFGSACMTALCRANVQRLHIIWPLASQLWLNAVSLLSECPVSIVEDAAEIAVLIAKEQKIAGAATPRSGESPARSRTASTVDGDDTALETNQSFGSSRQSSALLVLEEGEAIEPFALLLELYTTSLSDSICNCILRELHKALGQVAPKLTTKSWCAVLKLIESTTLKAITITNKVEGGVTADINTVIAAACDDVSFAFRTLEMIQHGSITNLGYEGLLAMIACVGEYVHFGGATSAVGEKKAQSPGTGDAPQVATTDSSALLRPVVDRGINVSLSAVQLAWSLADYLVAADGSNASPHHWNTLMLQLRDGCLDSRHEVRQSSTKTMFSLIITHGSLLPAECWGTCIWDVVIPLGERIAAVSVDLYTRKEEESSGKSPQERRRENSGIIRPGERSEEWATPKQVQELTIAVLEFIGRIFKLFNHEMEEHVPNFASAARGRLHAVICNAASLTKKSASGNHEDVVLAAVKVLHATLAAHATLNLNASEVATLFVALEGIAISPECHDSVGDGGASSSSFTTNHDATQSTKVMCAVLASLSGFIIQHQTSSAATSTPGTISNSTNYMPRVLMALEASQTTFASTGSYMSPSQVQTQVLEELAKLLPLFTTETEWHSATTLLLGSMPTLAVLQKGVAVRDDPAKRRPLQGIKDLLPKLHHPKQLMKVTDFLIEELFRQCPLDIALYLLPQAIRAISTTILLRSAFVTRYVEEQCNVPLNAAVFSSGEDTSAVSKHLKREDGSSVDSGDVEHAITAAEKLLAEDALGETALRSIEKLLLTICLPDAIASEDENVAATTDGASPAPNNFNMSHAELWRNMAKYRHLYQQASKQSAAAIGEVMVLMLHRLEMILDNGSAEDCNSLISMLEEVLKRTTATQDGGSGTQASAETAVVAIKAIIPISTSSNAKLGKIVRHACDILNQYSDVEFGDTQRFQGLRSLAMSSQGDRVTSIIKRYLAVCAERKEQAGGNLSGSCSPTKSAEGGDDNDEFCGLEALLVSTLASVAPSVADGCTPTDDQEEKMEAQRLLPDLTLLITVDSPAVRVEVQSAMQRILKLLNMS